ncbi:hypothetical protein Xsto_03244 [Xenorhabdus stockiae]|uniref:Uncharacterized protein n=2 Tax=Xenorhabdus stockiae TaxID=351614 RepID=A0A2D0KLA9_9GAMM|nr:hypothetical protein Xsto_03244 [Xenorhabdus stockiae]
MLALRYRAMAEVAHDRGGYSATARTIKRLAKIETAKSTSPIDFSVSVK